MRQAKSSLWLSAVAFWFWLQGNVSVLTLLTSDAECDRFTPSNQTLITQERESSTIGVSYLCRIFPLILSQHTHRAKLVSSKAQHSDLIIKFHLREMFQFVLMKNMVIWKQLSILVTKGPVWVILSTSLWGILPVVCGPVQKLRNLAPLLVKTCTSHNAVWTAIWLEQTRRQAQSKNLPTKRDIRGSSSLPHHTQVSLSQLPSLSSP